MNGPIETPTRACQQCPCERIKARGLCRRCYLRHYQRGDLDRFPLLRWVRPDELDDIAVERAAAGDPVNLTTWERREAVRLLTQRGLSSAAIGRRLRRSERSIQRTRSALAREAA